MPEPNNRLIRVLGIAKLWKHACGTMQSFQQQPEVLADLEIPTHVLNLNIKSPFMPAYGVLNFSGSSKGDHFPQISQKAAEEEEGDPVAKDLKAPEQKLTLVAFRLALLEKCACAFGQLAFIWATVVLLGGFVGTLQVFDFWLISALLITEGARVFCRSQELEWQNAATRSIFSKNRLTKKIKDSAVANKIATATQERCVENDGSMKATPMMETASELGDAEESPRADNDDSDATIQEMKKKIFVLLNIKRTWTFDALPFIPYASFLLAKRISGFLYFMQLISAVVTIGFSLERLSRQKYGEADSAQPNRNNALNVYYALMFTEAFVFLIERAYWEIKFTWKKLLEEVTEQCNLSEEHFDIVRQFFYDVYSCSLKGSIFDGIEKDLVSFGIDRIESSSGKEQMGGVWIMCAFVKHESFAGDAVRRIGTTPGVIERLLDMLTWKADEEREIRRATASVICELAHHENNCFRMVATAGGLEGIVSLLVEKDQEIKLLGLRILKRLARDHRHCVKIGQTRGLILLLVNCLDMNDVLKNDNGMKVMKHDILKKSLQILKMLSETTGGSGEPIRNAIAKAVFALGRLKDIAERGSQDVQRRAVDILTSLALEDDIRMAIGNSGNAIKVLLDLFLKRKDPSTAEHVVSLKAGEALNLLALNCPRNCIRIIGRRHSHDEPCSTILNCILVQLQEEPKVATCAAKILRHLCDHINEQERELLASYMPELIKMIIRGRDSRLEAALGLAAKAIPLLQPPCYASLLDTINKDLIVKVVMRLVSGPATSPPLTRLPRIRRHTVEFVMELMKADEFFVVAFKEHDLESKLTPMLDCISEVENFYTFSGGMGVARHRYSMEDLIEATLHYLRDSSCPHPLHPLGCFAPTM